MTSPPRAALRLLLALLLTVDTPHIHATPADDAPDFREAMAAHQSRQWQQSYAALAVLADGGHVHAARVAAQMHRWGPRLYSRRFVATTAQLAHWQQLAADQGASARAAKTSLSSEPMALLHRSWK